MKDTTCLAIICLCVMGIVAIALGRVPCIKVKHGEIDAADEASPSVPEKAKHTPPTVRKRRKHATKRKPSVNKLKAQSKKKKKKK